MVGLMPVGDIDGREKCAAIFAGWRNRLIDEATLDQAALFPVIKEEGFVSFLCYRACPKLQGRLR